MSRARLLTALLALAGPAAAQTGYRDLDGGRPARLEDATVTERDALELQLPTVRLERVAGGFYRWRLEPKVSYGFMPHAEIELRVPFVYREGAATPRGGLAGVGISAAYALNTETLGWPGMAVGVEALLPAGAAAAPVAAASVRGLVTRTFGFGRVHLNGSVGNYGVVVAPSSAPPVGTSCPPGTIRNSQGVCVTLPPDFPCLVDGTDAAAACRPAAVFAARARQQVVTETVRGTRWAAGLGADRAFALRSTLVVADVFVERLEGLGRPAEVSAELGARRQAGVRTVLDAGWGTRLTGPQRAWYLNAGATYALGVRRARR